MRKTIYTWLAVIFCLLLIVFLVACSNNNSNFDESFKNQMDIAMQNVNDTTVLASVNDIEITQTNKDVYLISDETYTTEEIVKMVVIEDYAKKHNLKINQNAQNRIDSMRQSMENDKTLTNEYCLKTYGISKAEVIEYMINRSSQIWLNDAFSDMIIDQVSSGECPKIYPCLQEAYDRFEKDKLSDGSKAWDEIEQAYYEMITKDYEIVIY
ncbi:MAG: hypothetical protein HFJ97_06840 [Eubacterium sp.]|nr:hypothetical protein [Eubacterium sp.]